MKQLQVIYDDEQILIMPHSALAEVSNRFEFEFANIAQRDDDLPGYILSIGAVDRLEAFLEREGFGRSGWRPALSVRL
ncbi:hypothetical protein [Gluconobacter kondonii]|uniref:hypothetical protein n=1 Tax=Gluconobacter kondonii TaxID=941463 RepID=UPI001B8B44BA|nr:hypothetical protein [Gluconobacter kondonii]MBS1054749.1 hypothetical protein [Gluconobacter kondonii]